MTIKRVYVQAENGVPTDEAFFKAWDGFRKRRIPCELFEPPQLAAGQVALSRETLVAGGLRVVEQAMKLIGMKVPEADNLPQCLAQYRGRDVWTSTWGELLDTYRKSGHPRPLFVKPRRRNKGFPAVALYNADDFEAAAKLPREMEVLVSEYVLFESEWRCYVCEGRLLTICHYQGDAFKFPDPQVIQSALNDFSPMAPAGFGIDFGVLTDGRTVLVEVNDGYSLGSYNMNSVEYAELLEARWEQLAKM